MQSGQPKHRETEGAQTALESRVTKQLTPHETEAGGDGTQPAPMETPSAPGRSRAVAPWIAAMGSVLLLGALLLLLADAGPPSLAGGQAQTRPTATPSPSPTATLIPTATPNGGFQVYRDQADGFLIQYPIGWVSSPASPGIEFADDEKAPEYIMQVLLPSNSAVPGLDGTDHDATTLVNYEMDRLASQWPQGAFSRVPGPVPTERIGGVTWQGATGLISSNQTRIRVQVYATLYQGKPYVINVLASDERYSLGNVEYFTTMLHSFVFLPPNS